MKFKPIRIAKGAPPESTGRQGRPSRRATGKSRPVSRSQSVVSPDGCFDGTVVYTHGIANKPPASVLKCQWDRALFGTGLGQRTRMVYWVNRDRYPDPDRATCNDRDFSEGAALVGEDDQVVRDEQRSMRIQLAEEQASRLLSESSAPTSQKQKWEVQLKGIAEQLESNAAQSYESFGDAHAEVLPLPRWARERLTRAFTKLLLNDVYDYFFDARNARRIDRIFESRLSRGPLVVVGHSLGSVIAYRNLCQSDLLEPGSVRLFVTIGSPLGIQEVQDNLREIAATLTGLVKSLIA